jgi:hypothetical protein
MQYRTLGRTQRAPRAAHDGAPRRSVALTDEILDRIDQIVPPGTDVGTLDQAYLPPALQSPSLRRRPVNERAAA